MPDLVAVEADDEHALGGADVEHDRAARPRPSGSSNVALVDAGRVQRPGSSGGSAGNGIWTLV